MEKENIEFEEVTEQEEFNTLEDMGDNYIRSPKVGDKVEFVIKGFKKISEKSELEFTFKEDGKQKSASNALSKVDYGVQLHTDAGAIFWVNSWSVWGQLKAIAKKLNSNNFAGLEVEINHPLNGMLKENKEICWVVKVKINGEYKQLDRDSNDWV